MARNLELLNQLDGEIAELEKMLTKRSRPATNNPNDQYEPSAYPDDDDDRDGEFDDQINQMADEDSDPDVDPDQDELDNGELDPDDDEDTDPPLSLRNNRNRMGKSYSQVQSGTAFTNSPPAQTHKFESKIAYIKARDGCSASEATSRARKENPVLYESYLKSGLAKSYGDLVHAEIRKGFSQTVAEQRVLHAHGHNIALPDINKSADVVDFMQITNSIMQKRGCSRVEAMRLARIRNPHAFGRYQEV